MQGRVPRFRWRIAAPFSLRPTGERFLLERETLDAELAKRVGTVEVTLPNLGANAPRTARLTFDRISRWTIRGVVERIDVLAKLAALAAENDAGSDSWLERVAALVGEGELVAGLRALSKEESAPPSAEPHRTKTAAVAAIDAFLRTSRGANGASSTAPAKRTRFREALEASVDAAAKQVLSAPELVALEATYRGARWLTEARRDAPIQIEAVDTTRLDDLFEPSHASELADFEAPDLLFATGASDIDALVAASAQAERAHAPLVAHGPSGPGVVDLELVLGAERAPRWAAFREEDDARWLCAVRNDVVLLDEGTGAAVRTVFGSPVFGLAVLLAASYRESGSFTRVLGQVGQQKAPATWLPNGPGPDEWPLPTRELGSLRLQTEAANVGVTLVGSPRRGDSILVAELPTASSAKDARSLTTQAWVGRIVRFGGWAVASLPTDTPDDQVDVLLGQLARVVLFPGMDVGTHLRAVVVPREKGAADLRIEARAEAPVVGVPLEIAFELPWRPAGKGHRPH